MRTLFVVTERRADFSRCKPILEIIDTKNPSTLILENVRNLQTIHKGKTFDIIKTEVPDKFDITLT